MKERQKENLKRQKQRKKEFTNKQTNQWKKEKLLNLDNETRVMKLGWNSPMRFWTPLIDLCDEEFYIIQPDWGPQERICLIHVSSTFWTGLKAKKCVDLIHYHREPEQHYEVACLFIDNWPTNSRYFGTFYLNSCSACDHKQRVKMKCSFLFSSCH